MVKYAKVGPEGVVRNRIWKKIVQESLYEEQFGTKG